MSTYVCTHQYVGGIEKGVYVTKPPDHQIGVQSTVSGLLLHIKHCTHSCHVLAQRTEILTLKNQSKEKGVRMVLECVRMVCYNYAASTACSTEHVHGKPVLKYCTILHNAQSYTVQ